MVVIPFYIQQLLIIIYLLLINRVFDGYGMYLPDV